MTKILVVFGATGVQGGSVIHHVLNDPELSQEFEIRAITRDVNSEKAKQLKEKVDVVEGDILNPTSIENALAGAHTVFAITTPSFGPDAVEAEFNNAKTIADMAVKNGAAYIVFSTLPSVSELSNGKYTHVTPFDAKFLAEKYIRGLPIKSAFVAYGFFMENFQSQPFLNPQKAPDGKTWVLSRHISSKNRLPYIDATRDGGKFVGAILAEPDKFEGKTFCAAAGLYSFEEIVTLLSKTTGKPVVFKQISLEEFTKSIPFAPALFADAFCYQEEFGGYFGPETEKLVAWAAENVKGRLNTLGEYLEAHPLELV